jgi:hypothetical protein
MPWGREDGRCPVSQALLALKNEGTPSRGTSASRGAAGGLRITAPGNAFEREADRVADAVMSADRALPRWSLSKVDMHAPLQRKCPGCCRTGFQRNRNRKGVGIA